MKTNNLFLAAVVALASFSTTIAQETDFGIKAGVNYSTLSGNEGGETNYLLGFHAGLVAEIMINPIFAVQPELLYSMEGAESSFSLEEEDMSFSGEQKIKLGYIQFPVMLKYFATDAFSLQAGPQVGYLVSAKNEYKFSSSFADDLDLNESGTEDIREEVKKVAFGVNFGLGYEIDDSLFLQARYHLGLADIDSTQEDPNEEFDIDFPKIKNSGFQLSVGYRF